MTQTPAEGESVHLDFLLYLRSRGFAVSVDQYMSAHALVGEYVRARAFASAKAFGDDTLKTLICPVFAKDSKQQAAFYAVFDDYVEHLSTRGGEEETQEEQVFIPPPPWWEALAYACAILLLLVAAALPALLASRADNTTNSTINTNSNVTLNANDNPGGNMNAGGNANNAEESSNATEDKRSAVRHGRDRNDNPDANATNVNVENANIINSNINSDIASANVNAGDTQPTPPGVAEAAPVMPTPAPTPPTPAPPSYYYALALAIPFTVFLFSELILHLRRKLALGRQTPRKPPASWPLRVETQPPHLYDSEDFHKAARTLRRRQVAEYHRLDIPATISATVAALGFPDFRYKPDSKVPEYVVLIERASARDHQARLFDELANALQREGLFLTRLFYEGDPRVCCDESGRECALLSEMQNRHVGQRLLLFGDGDALIDVETGGLVNWAGVFSEWQERALLTPAPRWGLREKRLADLFIVAPSTPEGISALAARFESLVVDNLPLWQRGGSEVPAHGEPQLAEALREHLGARVFRWFAACAVYPELQWDLTLYLGSLPSIGGGRKFGEKELLRLVRLPWFREGSMPDDVRRLLIEELEREDPSALAEVRAALVGFLERESPPEGSVAAEQHALELAAQRWLLRRDDASLARLRATVRGVRPGQILQDRTLVRYLERLPNLFYDLLLPRSLRPLFFRHGLPLLGMRMLGRFLLALLFACAALLLVWARIIPTPAQPPPPTPTPTPSTTPTPTPTPPVVLPPASPTPTSSPTPSTTPTPRTTPTPTPSVTLELEVVTPDGKLFGKRVGIRLYTPNGENGANNLMVGDASHIIRIPNLQPQPRLNVAVILLGGPLHPVYIGLATVSLMRGGTVRTKVIMYPESTPAPTPSPTPTPLDLPLVVPSPMPRPLPLRPSPTPSPTPPRGDSGIDQQKVTLKALEVRFSTVGSTKPGGTMNVRVLADDKEIGNASASRWMRNSLRVTVILRRPLPLSACHNLVLEVHRLISRLDSRVAPSFTLASASGNLSAPITSAYFGISGVKVSVSGILSDGRSVPLNPNSKPYISVNITVPLNCPSP